MANRGDPASQEVLDGVFGISKHTIGSDASPSHHFRKAAAAYEWTAGPSRTDVAQWADQAVQLRRRHAAAKEHIPARNNLVYYKR